MTLALHFFSYGFAFIFLWILSTFFTNIAQSAYPDEVCATGDVQYPYDSVRDPRTIMGTYVKINTDGLALSSDVNTSAPMYRHSYDVIPVDGTDESQYLFKSIGVGWVISASLPVSGATVFIPFACFKDDLFDCTYSQWYGGYNKYDFPIPTFKTLPKACSTYICARGIMIQLDTSVYTSSPNGEYNRSMDAASGRHKWAHMENPDVQWHYRVDAVSGSQNWILGESSSDRIACAPGYVDSPLFCTTFIYAGAGLNPQLSRDHFGESEADGGNDTFKMGLCQTSSPTAEPTAITLPPSTAEPTSTAAPTVTVTCDYDEGSLSIGDKVNIPCAFGYNGTSDTYTCLSTGEMEFIRGCFLLSFSDEFFEFNADRWTVYDPSGASGAAALANDGGDEFTFIPDNASFVGVIHSAKAIAYPARVRAVIRKQLDECNLFSIAMGKEWATRRPHSTRLNWYCDSTNDYRQFSIYNSSFRLYDSKCWEDPSIGAMEVVYTVSIDNTNRTQVTTNVSDCATLTLWTHDMSGNGWSGDAYLWLGSYTDSFYNYDTINQPIVSRFASVAYTQFFSDFNDRLDIWNNEADAVQSVMCKGGTLSTNTNSYQFRIPFSIRLGVRKPAVNNGVFAQFVSLGASDYVDEITNNVVQIVWNEKRNMTLAYAAQHIYQTGFEDGTDCQWERDNTEFHVTIHVDTTHIMVSDALCDSSLVAAHDLVVNQTTLSVGFANNQDYDDGECTEFTYIEVYQLPIAYAGGVADLQALSNVIGNATLPPIREIEPPETTQEIETTPNAVMSSSSTPYVMETTQAMEDVNENKETRTQSRRLLFVCSVVMISLMKF